MYLQCCSSRYLMCLYLTKMRQRLFMFLVDHCGTGWLILSRILNCLITFVGMWKGYTKLIASLPLVFSMSHGLPMHSGMLRHVFIWQIIWLLRTYTCHMISHRSLKAVTRFTSSFMLTRLSCPALAQQRATQSLHIVPIFQLQFEMGMVLMVGAWSGGYWL